MKKVSYLFAVAVLSLASCTGNKSYTIKGSIEGASDGDTVFLQKRDNGQFNKLDSAVIANGEFTFKGSQDSVINCYITYAKGDNHLFMDFFLENGKIDVKVGKKDDSAIGTPNNDAYQEFRAKMNSLKNKQNEIYQSMGDTTLTDKQREEKIAEMNKLEDSMMEVIKTSIDKNITNTIGIYLLSQYNYYLEYSELKPILEKVPAKYQNDKNIIQIKEFVESSAKTAVGQKYVDFSMLTPDEKPIKLSDYAGKGKIVLVDFWASWCGPCRQEMPNLVDAYAKYKNKGFEIVGVSLDKDREAWKNGIKQLKITWPQMSDLKFWNCEGSKLYAVRSIPHTVLIDKDGTILARGIRGEELQSKLAELLK